MILAEYAELIDAHPLVHGRLVAAWFRRKKLEARLMANEIGRLLSGGEQADDDVMDGDAALAALGVVPRVFGGNDAATG